MEDELPHALTDWQYDRFMLVEVKNFQCNTVDVSRVYPASIKTNRDAISAPATAGTYFGSASVSPDAHELMRMRQNSLAWTKNDDRVVGGDILERCVTVFLAPLVVRYGFERTFEVAIDVVFVERIVELCFCTTLLSVKIIPKRKVHAGFANVRFIVWNTDDRSVMYSRFDLGIAVDTHLVTPSFELIVLYHRNMKSMVVAYDRKRGIGAGNDLLWKRDLPADLAHFKQLTMGSSIVMGRKTFESIGRALPGRENIVVSRHAIDVVDVVAVTSLQEAYNAAHGNIMIIGGGSIYGQALEETDVIYATEVDAVFPQATVFFPVLDNDWLEMTREHHDQDERNAYGYDFVTYRRAKF